MAIEPIYFPAQSEMPIVETVEHQSMQPAPTAEQQQIADEVFSREQSELVAALLAAQVGLGLLHNLAVDTFKQPAEQAPPPRKEKAEDEER